MPIHVTDQPVSSWAEFLDLARTQFEGRWHFRGCLDNHALESALERAAKSWGIPLAKLPALERRLFRDFKRTFPPRSDIVPPSREQDLDWLALMQHHGAPTRLLDFTYSPFIAAFFALEMLLKSPPRDGRKAVVWALSVKPMENELIANLIPAGKLRNEFAKYSRERAGTAFRAVFFEADTRLVFVTPTNPWRLNERLIVQQGLFLCPGDIGRSFEDNLQAVPDATDPSNIKRILLPRSVLSEAFASLRKMNISAASLFPGIDGYARSQHHALDFLRHVPLFEDTAY
jgi:hypothetical protein